MTEISAIIIASVLTISIIFSLLGVIGLFRFKDFYTRIHAAGLIGSFGLIFAVIAVIIFAVFQCMNNHTEYLNFIVHAVFALIISFITATTSTHAIARSAYRSGNVSKISVVDALRKDSEKLKKQEDTK